MKWNRRMGRLAVALLALAGSASASNVTVSTGLLAGLNGNQIAQAFELMWTDGSQYACAVQQNVLVVTNTNGDCTTPVSRYKFTVDGGVLNVNHTASLNVVCQSPLVANFELDGGGLVPLVIGDNAFASGGDTIHVNFVTLPPAVQSCGPSVPTWGLLALGVVLLAGGLRLVRPGAQPAA